MDFLAVHDNDHDSDLPEPFTISNWNEAKLGPVKTISEYRTISESAEFIEYNKDYTVRYRKQRRKARQWATDPRQEIIWRTIASLTGSTLPDVKAAVQQAIKATIPEA